MHQWAKQQRQKDECAEQMGSMLHPEVDATDRQESNQHQAGWRREELFPWSSIAA
jgi:hypothetical protein